MDASDFAQILTPLFDGMMHSLFQEKGAALHISILADKPAQDFIDAHAAILDSSFLHVEMPDALRRSLQRSDYIFSGIKTFHELNQAFPSLLDENGDRKPFEQFLNDVRSIDHTYNANYLRAEYDAAQAAASMAAKWEEFQEDGDRYNLQYRTVGDGHVRPEHAALDGITLPPSDPFWQSYFPPNGWACRCSAVQVRKSKYPATPHDEAMRLGEKALDKKGFFRFNPGQQRKTFPDYNPYTIRRCNDCDVAKGKANLVFVPENELCAACKMVRVLAKADAKQTRRLAKPLQGTDIVTDKFPHPIKISRASINEWTNQPNKHYQEKNQMLLRIHEVMKSVEYLGHAPAHSPKKGLVQSHIFSTMVKGEEQCIIIHEWQWGDYTLHSISDSPEKIKEFIKKE